MLALINSNINLNNFPGRYTTGDYSFNGQSFESSISLTMNSISSYQVTLNSRILKLLEEFSLLKDNWDEDDALAPKLEVIDNAKYLTKLLEKHGQPIYHTAPGPNGEIMLDIRNRFNKQSLEVIIYKNRTVVVIFPERGSPVQSDFDFTQLPDLLSWLNKD